MNKRIISFSLWGSSGTHFKWAIENIKEARIIYPGWVCRFYLANDVPENVEVDLLREGAEVHHYIPKYGSWEGLFWRFYPIMDKENEYVIIRDADSIVNWKERAAVDEWIESSLPFHIMRDHRQHTTEILGGMWGAKGGTFPNLKETVDFWISNVKRGEVNKGDDQVFLSNGIWPKIKSLHIAHDSTPYFDRYNCGNSRPFPQHRENHPYAPFIGAVIDDVIALKYEE